VFSFCFFFQAEDGIRDFHVTGVQTCALPICSKGMTASTCFWVRDIPCQLLGRIGVASAFGTGLFAQSNDVVKKLTFKFVDVLGRSEERRVGKECRSRGLRNYFKKRSQA